MSPVSADARAVVAAVDRLTTQVRHIATALSAPVAAPQPATDDAPTTADDGPRCVCGDPIEQTGDPAYWIHSPGSDTSCLDARPNLTARTIAHHVPAEAYTTWTEQAPVADDDQALRWARRESLLVLLTRLQRGRRLTEAEAGTLRQHVETEMREADTARAVAAGNLRHVQQIVPEIDRLAAELEDAERRADGFRTERDEAQAAIKQVQQTCHDLPYEHARRVLSALDGSDQPTTKAPEPLCVTPCNPPRMAIHCGGECLAIADSNPDRDRSDRVALVGDTLTVFTGTPNGAAPTLPAGAHYLAEVFVPRGTSAIRAANITSSGLLFHRPTTKE
ncbi:hypothetical protein [Streptomyces griseoviridis]|uniref:HPt (Histidine-containing phosphotransfer) domain-containing protein n=1 Tax=Streptomyces griseoviridis TaxID=45398 RepID=A0ABT9LF88_STRGD|nr:hypothetical protein [Streptomyces griseoviridis]MDP9682388.1 HPt (histidine-containing phosphotransfer) domain-containing protein [Streptomyces griseoviridis]GGS81819.1 hypothetical protein GCM10010240_13980 [Streptomyces griseoviridis]